MGNDHSRPALSAWPRSNSQTFFPDTAAREREDAAFYESMRFMQQERIDDSDDESDDESDEMHHFRRDKPSNDVSFFRIESADVLHLERGGCGFSWRLWIYNLCLLSEIHIFCDTSARHHHLNQTYAVFVPSVAMEDIVDIPVLNYVWHLALLFQFVQS